MVAPQNTNLVQYKPFCALSNSALLEPFYGSISAIKGCYNTHERQTQERQDFRVVVSFSLSERFGLRVGSGCFAVATSWNRGYLDCWILTPY